MIVSNQQDTIIVSNQQFTLYRTLLVPLVRGTEARSFLPLGTSIANEIVPNQHFEGVPGCGGHATRAPTWFQMGPLTLQIGWSPGKNNSMFQIHYHHG
jgi:hypothetical protein